MPLSAEALCWKKIIHGVTVAPIVDAISSSSVLKLPPGNGEPVRKAWPTWPQFGRTMIAATRKSPLKIAIPSTTRSQRQ
jgi:energy-converting hydrogenase Eha subunit A